MKAISLISVGIDSPVSTYLMKNQGIEVIGLNFETDHSIDEIGKKLNILIIKESMVNFHSKLPVDEKFRCILCKRFMYKKAEELAKREGAKFIITGENLGQVASQTIENMYVIDNSVKITVLRPLLCYDKNEIIKIARDIGTYELSIKGNEKCPYVPKVPAIKSKIELIKKLENDYQI